MISGLRNYLMSQDALGDAVGDALRSEEEALASHQLEAFHESFNFCIDCRQYTCVNCWNDGAGRCRSCQPIPGTDDLLERFEATFQAQHPELAEAELQRRMGVEAWPTSDLAGPASAPTNGHVELDWTQAALNGAGTAPEPEWPVAELVEAPPTAAAEELPEPVVEPQPIVAAAEPEPVVAAEQDLAIEPVAATPVVEEEPMLPVVHGVALPEVVEPAVVITWEDDALINLEAIAEVVAEPEPEPVVAEPEPEPVVAEVVAEPEPEPVVAEVVAEPEPEPVVAEVVAAPVPIRPVSETLVRLPPPAPVVPPAPPALPSEELRVAAEADDAQVAARRAKLELLGLGDQGEGPVTQRPTVVPYRSSGAQPVELAAAARSRGAAPAGFWDASAREVAGAASQVGVQACAHCGLSLSATARFCRRCGTRQDQPA